MIYEITGKNISEAHVVDISPFGIWLNVKGKEYFLPYSEFPWFKKALIDDVFEVRLEGEGHLRWSTLDIDLSLESIEDPSSFLMVYEP
jgi:hypothetical protein